MDIRVIFIVLICFLPSLAGMFLSAWMVHEGHPVWGAFWAVFAMVSAGNVEVTKR